LKTASFLARILTAVIQCQKPESEKSMHVKAMQARGADVIKIFASQSIRDGGGPTLSLNS
jgi:hypothetical protein